MNPKTLVEMMTRFLMKLKAGYRSSNWKFLFFSNSLVIPTTVGKESLLFCLLLLLLLLPMDAMYKRSPRPVTTPQPVYRVVLHYVHAVRHKEQNIALLVMAYFIRSRQHLLYRFLYRFSFRAFCFIKTKQ